MEENESYKYKKIEFGESEFLKILGLGGWELSSIDSDVRRILIDGKYGKQRNRKVRVELPRKED